MNRVSATFALLVAGIGVVCSGGDTSSAILASAEEAEARPTMAQPQSDPVRTAFPFDGVFRQGGVVRGRAPSNTLSLSLNGIDISLTEQGEFLIGFGRDHGASASLVARLDDGREIEERLTIAPTGWRIEHVNASRRDGSSSAEFRRRRAPEIAQIVAAREVQSDMQGWQQEFLWPVTGRVSGVFGSQRVCRGEPGFYHSGVDIARPRGTAIVAPADGGGVLATQTPFTLEGYLLIIDHGMGLNSAFLHLSRIDVSVGQAVRRGDRIDPGFLAGPMPVFANGAR